MGININVSAREKKVEAISYISSYQMLTADKNLKTYYARTKLKKSGLIYGAIAVKLLMRKWYIYQLG
jgi:hypothetical protein